VREAGLDDLLADPHVVLESSAAAEQEATSSCAALSSDCSFASSAATS
jgi:hypothetical protein